jgi:hypothetical protein
MGNVGENERATIVKDIAHIHFTTLTVLVLDGNNIESVAGLVRLQMAYIEIVGLGTYYNNVDNNNITSVGVIRKAAWPSL